MKKLTCMVAAAMAVAAGGAAADTFPDGPITWVVNWPAGGGQDTTSRLVASRLSEVLGVPIVIENYEGAGGLVGMRQLAGSEPDGYTIGMLGASSVIQQYTMDEPVMLDALTVLSFFGPDPAALSVGADTPFETLGDFVTAATEAPGSIPNGNDPPGGASYIAASILEMSLGIDLAKIPYGGFAPTVTALLGGEVASATVPVPQVIEHHNSGAVRILGVMAEERHFLAPDVPTFGELGFDVIAGDFRAIVGPAGIPEDRAAILAEALLSVTSSEEFVAAANAAGYMIESMGPDASMARIAAFDANVYPVLDDAGLVVNPR